MKGVVTYKGRMIDTRWKDGWTGWVLPGSCLGGQSKRELVVELHVGQVTGQPGR